jgi:hypothetical protein
MAFLPALLAILGFYFLVLAIIPLIFWGGHISTVGYAIKTQKENLDYHVIGS